MIAYRYFLNGTEVSKAEFVVAERSCGLNNTLGQPDEPATAGFSGWIDGKREVTGRVEWISDEEHDR